MDSLFLLIPVSLLLLGVVIGVFIWAVNNKQFDDLEKHGYAILFDHDNQVDKKPAAQPQDKPQ